MCRPTTWPCGAFSQLAYARLAKRLMSLVVPIANHGGHAVEHGLQMPAGRSQLGGAALDLQLQILRQLAQLALGGLALAVVANGAANALDFPVASGNGGHAHRHINGLAVGAAQHRFARGGLRPAITESTKLVSSVSSQLLSSRSCQRWPMRSRANEPKMRSAASFQLRIWPSRSWLMTASLVWCTMAASWACC